MQTGLFPILHIQLINCQWHLYYNWNLSAKLWSGNNFQNKTVSWSFLNSLVLFGPSKLFVGLMQYLLQIVVDESKTAFDHCLERRDPFFALCSWIRPSNIPSMYPYTIQLMGCFLPDHSILVVLLCFYLHSNQ